jgi:hypothetical protein
MSETLEGRSPVALIAEQLLEDARRGVKFGNANRGVKFGGEIGSVAPAERKTNFKALMLLAALCLVGTYYAPEFFKNKVEGFAVDGKSRLLLCNSTVVFYETESERQYFCKTNKRGNFSTRLPSGNYQFWVKDHGTPETARGTVEINGERNCIVTSFAKTESNKKEKK